MFSDRGEVVLVEILKATPPSHLLLTIACVIMSLCSGLEACPCLCRCANGLLALIQLRIGAGSPLAVLRGEAAHASLTEALHPGGW